MDLNHGDLEGRSRGVLAVTIAMVVCALVFVSLRLVSRIGIVKRVYADDYFVSLKARASRKSKC